MARIFMQKNMFHKRLPSSFLEGEFEQIIGLQAPDLYPDYHVIPFKKRVTSSFGTKTPDLVFIAKDYRDWYVVEVEMAYHSFESHVEPQIHVLATANYAEDNVISYVCRQYPTLDWTETSRLIRNEAPKILLILNEPKDSWAKELKSKYGVITSVFEVYFNSGSDSQVAPPYNVYGISNHYPVYSLSVTTHCSVHPHYAYLGVEDNSNLQLQPGQDIKLEFDGCLTLWKVCQGPNSTLWLRMQGRDQCINRKKSYQITKLRDSSLFLCMT